MGDITPANPGHQALLQPRIQNQDCNWMRDTHLGSLEETLQRNWEEVRLHQYPDLGVLPVHLLGREAYESRKEEE